MNFLKNQAYYSFFGPLAGQKNYLLNKVGRSVFVPHFCGAQKHYKKLLIIGGLWLLAWMVTSCAPLAPAQAMVTPINTACEGCAFQSATPTSPRPSPKGEGATPSPSGEGWGEVSDTPTAWPTIPAATLQALLSTLAATPPSATTVPGTPVATSEPRLPPEQWQQWPIVPNATTRSRLIYQQGQALGSDPHSFSKIGDCQSVTAAFFGIYDKPGAYELPNGYDQLKQTIAWFSGSYGRDSQAVRGGFNVASVLSSLWADPKACRSGETPLDCEFRLHKPSIVLISMETGFEGRTAAVYEKYMRRIIESAIARGASPILATKADNFEGDQSINLTTARLAAEYDLPLWNFWRAVQPLPDQGMDITRPDKFHISVDAWNVRSFTGLQALDSVWRGVQ